MKSSALALITAAALLFGANAVSFAQEANSATTTAPASTEECLALAEAGTPDGESLVGDQENEADQQSATGGETSQSDSTGAVDDTTPADCPEGTGAGAAMTAAPDGAAAATATTMPTAEECLALQGAGATAPGESLVNEQESDNNNETATGTESSGADATGAIDDESPEGCPDVTEAN